MGEKSLGIFALRRPKNTVAPCALAAFDKEMRGGKRVGWGVTPFAGRFDKTRKDMRFSDLACDVFIFDA